MPHQPTRQAGTWLVGARTPPWPGVAGALAVSSCPGPPCPGCRASTGKLLGQRTALSDQDNQASADHPGQAASGDQPAVRDDDQAFQAAPAPTSDISARPAATRLIVTHDRRSGVRPSVPGPVEHETGGPARPGPARPGRSASRECVEAPLAEIPRRDLPTGREPALALRRARSAHGTGLFQFAHSAA